MKLAPNPTLHASPEMADRLPNDPDHPSVRVLSHGSMEVRWYRPHGEAKHLPHDRDEVYVVTAGTARFHRSNEAGAFEEQRLGLLGEQVVSVAAGHVLFVPAGAEHHFDELSLDFQAWAVFYGPEGGEKP